MNEKDTSADLTVSGASCAEITPDYDTDLSVELDPGAVLRTILVDPLYATGSTISEGSTVLDAENLSLAVSTYLYDDYLEPATDARLKTLYSAFCPDFSAETVVPFREFFAIRAANRAQLPDPHPEEAVYTPVDDVIPTAQELSTKRSRNPDAFFASLAYTYGPDTVGFGFANTEAFTAFKEWLATAMTPVLAEAPPATLKLMSSFVEKITLEGLTESLRLRTDTHNGLGARSFARVIIALLLQYQRERTAADPHQCEVFVLPFTLYSLVVPESLVLVNVEAHAEASAAAINTEWQAIVDSIYLSTPPLSLREITRLTEALDEKDRSVQRMSQMDRQAREDRDATQAKYLNFSTNAPSTVDLAAEIEARIKHYGHVNKSMNIVRSTKSSYARPNRRDPDDFNRAGRITKLRYIPDFHIYLDCSASISPENYRDAVISLIRFAKKFDVDVYLNSFSTRISQSVRIPVKGRSVASIWNLIQAVPKVSGGTDFSVVWDYVLANPARAKEFSLMITDFGYHAPTTRVEHPPRMHYAPCGEIDWETITFWATTFATSIAHIDNTVASKFIGMH